MEYKPGWQAGPGGGNMVQNTATGQVVDTNHPVYANYQAPNTAGGAAAPITTQQQVGSTTAPVGGTIAQGAPTTVAESYQQALVNKLNQQPLSASSPEVAPAITANKLAEQRNFERNRSLVAERAAANGTSNSGGFETRLLGLSQDRAAREGQFAGDALMRAMTERGVNDRFALGQAGGLLGGNASNDLQRYGIDTDASVRREGIGAQSELGQGQLNLGLLSALLGNDQFGRGLAQQGAQFGAGLDQQGLLGLLGLL